MKAYKAIKLCRKHGKCLQTCPQQPSEINGFLTPNAGWPSSRLCKVKDGQQNHKPLGPPGNWGQSLVQLTLQIVPSRDHGMGPAAHITLVSLTHRLSAAPIIAWHYHPYLFSWIFIIYYTSLPGRAPGDPSSIMALKEDLIGRAPVLFSFLFPLESGNEL